MRGSGGREWGGRGAIVVDAGGDDVKVGDEVTLLGGGIAPEELADWTGTNEYEVMTNISTRVPRVYVGAVQ